MGSTTTLEKYPYKLFDDTGTAFTLGLFGSTFYHLIKGTIKPTVGNHLTGGILAVRSNAPRVATSFALWGGTFSAFDYAISSARKKDDAWNTIIAAAATGGVLRLRCGLRASVIGAVAGGVLFGVVNGVGIFMNRALSPPPSVVFNDPGMKSMVGGGVPPGSIKTDEKSEHEDDEKIPKLERLFWNSLDGLLIRKILYGSELLTNNTRTF